MPKLVDRLLRYERSLSNQYRKELEANSSSDESKTALTKLKSVFLYNLIFFLLSISINLRENSRVL